MPSNRVFVVALLCVTLSAAAEPLRAGGFLFFEQASKPTALGGAFVAQADDPSAIFYNVGGLALLGKKPKVTAGATFFSRSNSLFQGLPPGLGTETNGEQEGLLDVVPHAYLVTAVSERIKFGLGLNSPFRLQSEWAGKDDFPGRHLSLRSEIDTLDLNPSAGFKLTPRLGVGAGVTYRTTSVSMLRRLQRVNPFNGQLVDVASSEVDTGTNDGFGWNAGLLHRAGRRVSWGLSYRSEIEVDYTGEGRFTQIPTGNDQLDALIRATVPFDRDLGVTTTITFPDLATFGLAIHLSDDLTVEADFSRTGWSSFERLAIRFPGNPELDHTTVQNWDDSDTLRLGARYKLKSGSELRFGVAADDSPQPEEAVGPFLPDADRTVITVGYGKDWLDLAFMWVDSGRRTTTSNVDDLNGNYSANSWLLSLSASM